MSKNNSVVDLAGTKRADIEHTEGQVKHLLKGVLQNVGAVVAVICVCHLTTPGALSADVVSIPDPGLAQVIGAELTKPCGSAISNSEMVTLTSLVACRRGITSLGGLESASNLVTLDISGNSVSDLSPLASLPNLTSLNAGGNLISDLSALSGLTNLSELSLYGNYIADLSGIGNLDHLSSLCLLNCGISNAAPLANLTNLNCLDLRWNSISNDALQAICTNLTNLTSLHVGGSAAFPVTNLDFLGALTGLRLLDVEYAGISNSAALSALTNLTNLTYLVLRGNPGITNYSVLSGLTGLVSLELRQNAISNLTFLTNLTQLQYADLAYNPDLSDISPLAELTNLSAVNLAGDSNSDTNYAAQLPAIMNLWLFDKGVGDVTLPFLARLARLTGLGLDDNLITDPAPLTALTNLDYLGLSRNPLTNYAVLASFTNLTALWLDGNPSSGFNDPSFARGLFGLRNLSIQNNQLGDLNDLGGLTNLSALYASGNRLTDISALTKLLTSPPRHLSRVDVSANLLASGTHGFAESLNVIRILECAGVEVEYLPVDEPPAVPVPSSVAGVYGGLFVEAESISLQSAGYFKATVSRKGAFSASIWFGRKSYSFSGRFPANGSYSISFARRRSPISAQLQLDSSGGNMIFGQVSGASWSAHLAAFRAAYNAKTNPAPQAGKYTLLIPGAAAQSSGQPGGDSPGIVRVRPSGRVTFLGKLADGSPVSQQTMVFPDGHWPLYAAPYSGKGLVLGWLTFAQSPTNDLQGLVSWIKPPLSTRRQARPGFTHQAVVIGSTYQFARGMPILNFASGQLCLTNRDGAEGFTNPFVFGNQTRATGANGLRLRIAGGSGLFHGSVVNPSTRRRVPFTGVVLQKQNYGAGYFLDTNQSGQVIIQAQ